MEHQNSEFRPVKPQFSPILLLLFLVVFCLGGIFVGQFAGYVIGLGFGLDMMNMADIYGTPNGRVPLLLVQLAYSLSLFVLAPYIFLRYFEHDLLKNKLVGSSPFPNLLIPLTIITVFSYFPLSGYLVELNQGVTFPDSMKALEQTLKSLEETFAEMTTYIVAFDSFGQFLLGLVVIAIVPAIGEEFLFRGVVQTYLGRLVKNPHVAIWLSAFIFSAFHFQFYGLLPRMVLGAFFGYLFWWSGRLIFPMLAHFINNGFTLLIMYLHHIGMIDMNIEEANSFPVIAALLSGIVTVILLIVFKKAASPHYQPSFD